MSIADVFHKGDPVRLSAAGAADHPRYRGQTGVVANEPRHRRGTVAVRFESMAPASKCIMGRHHLERVERPESPNSGRSGHVDRQPVS